MTTIDRADRYEHLRHAMDARREELRDAVAGLVTAARSLADPREDIRARPVLWLAGAFAVGFVLGAR